MNKMISNPSSSNASIAHTLETLEALEESIISSIRSAGIPQKAREINIVDKMMDLRRDRKKVISSLHQLPAIYEDIIQAKLLKYFDNIDEVMESQAKFSPKKRQQQQNLLSALTLGDKDDVSVISSRSSASASIQSKGGFQASVGLDGARRAFQERMDILESEIQRSADYSIELKLVQVKEMIEKEKLMDDLNHKQKIDQMKEKYEGKLAMLEEKMTEVFNAKVAAKDSEISNKIARMKESLEGQLISKFNEKSRKYKDAIVDLEDTVNKSKLTINKLVAKLSETEDTLKLTIERLNQKNAELINSDKQILMLRENNNLISNELSSLKLHFEKNQETNRREVEQLKADHQRELERVDYKIRQLMNSKDVTIKKLQSMFKESEDKRTDIEKMLLDLNSDLSNR